MLKTTKNTNLQYVIPTRSKGHAGGRLGRYYGHRRKAEGNGVWVRKFMPGQHATTSTLAEGNINCPASMMDAPPLPPPLSDVHTHHFPTIARARGIYTPRATGHPMPSGLSPPICMIRHARDICEAGSRCCSKFNLFHVSPINRRSAIAIWVAGRVAATGRDTPTERRGPWHLYRRQRRHKILFASCT